MLRALVVVALVLAVPAALAGSVRSVATPGPVTAIALDARMVAFAEGRSARDCDRIRLWDLRTRRVTKLGRTTSCVRTSTGTGIASLALAGGRVLWLHYTGGNVREWRLFTATRFSPRPRQLRFAAADVDGAPPIVVGDGESSARGSLLPYAVGRDVVVLHPSGARAYVWRAPGRVTALAAGSGRLAVASEGGVVTVLDGEGRPESVETLPGDATSVRLSGTGFLAEVGPWLELRRPAMKRAYRLPHLTFLEDATGERAFVSGRGRIRQLDVRHGTWSDLGPGVDVAVQLSTLAIADGRRATARPLP